MDLLITNDDGIDAAGLGALERAMAALGTTWTVAPQVEQSSKGHGFSLHHPVRVEARGERRWAVTGTPADCAYVALHGVLPRKPVLAVSGINHGSNLGTDVFYSGTVAAAMEAVFQGVPAIAVSLHRHGSAPFAHFDTAGAVAARVARHVLAHGLPRNVVLNINVPDVPLEELRGVRAAAQGWRHYEPSVDERTDPRGKAYYWLGGAHAGFEPVDGTDGPVIEQGFATVTPLHTDMTRHDVLADLAAWVDQDGTEAGS